MILPWGKLVYPSGCFGGLSKEHSDLPTTAVLASLEQEGSRNNLVKQRPLPS